MFRPPKLLAFQIVPTAANIPAGRPRLLRPSRTCVVTFARIGYAIRLTTGNWRNEDLHLARYSALSAAPYLCESFLGCLGPYHGGSAECTCLFLPPRHRPSPVHYRGRLPALTRQNDFMTDPLFETAAISLCSGPQVCSIGIERRRASRRWRVSILALSVCRVGSQFHHSHVSRGPPIIPDGRVSQVRFEVLACRQRAFPNRPELKR